MIGTGGVSPDVMVYATLVFWMLVEAVTVSVTAQVPTPNVQVGVGDVRLSQVAPGAVQEYARPLPVGSNEPVPSKWTTSGADPFVTSDWMSADGTPYERRLIVPLSKLG